MPRRMAKARAKTSRLEEKLERVKARLAASREKEKSLKTIQENLKRLKKEQEDQLREAVSGYTHELDIMGHQLQKDELNDQESQCLTMVQNVRNLMAEGKVEEARAAERSLAETLNNDEDDAWGLPYPGFVGQPGEIVQKATFVRPFSICSEEEIASTIEYAAENPDKVHRDQMDMMEMMTFASSMSGYAHKMRSKCPKGVNLEILNEIRSFSRVFDKVNETLGPTLEESNDEEEFYGSDYDEEDDDDEESRRSVTWEVIVDAVHNHQQKKLKYNKLQLELPSEKTAPIARFNTDAHYRFSSPASLEATPSLSRAVTRCELREIPAYDLDTSGRTCAPRPFLFRQVFEEVFSMDVEGDMIATCSGDEVCAANVPRYSDPAQADYDDGLPNHRQIGHKEENSFLECIADSERGLVWASSGRGEVYGFSATGSNDSKKQQVGMLSFGREEKAACRRFLGGRPFGICRVGDCIVGCGSTKQLSIWNIKESLDYYEDMANKNETNMKGFGPRLLQIENEASHFKCGDVAWIGGSSLLLGAERSDERREPSMRQVDLAHEKVVGLYCGLKGNTSIEKQYCVEQFKSVFVADSHASYVFDTRTFKPCFTLETGHLDGQILGVPCEASMAAFTFSNSDTEEIQCWDLRMPASHCYSMWTGNSDIKSLFWDDTSASLIAATSSSHSTSWGIHGEYRYGEIIDSDLKIIPCQSR